MPSYWPNMQGGGWGAAIGGGLTSGITAVKGMTDIAGDEQKQALLKEEADKARLAYEGTQIPVPVEKYLKVFSPHYRKAMNELLVTDGIVEDMSGEKVVKKGKLKEFTDDFQKNMFKQALVVKAGQDHVTEAKKVFQEAYDVVNPEYQQWEKSWKDKLQKAVDPETGIVDMKKQSEIKKQMAEHGEYNDVKKQREDLTNHMRAIEEQEIKEQTKMNLLNEKHKELTKLYPKEWVHDIENNRMTEEEAYWKKKQGEAQLTADAYMNKTRAGETIKSEVRSKEPTPDMKLVEAWKNEKDPEKKAQYQKLLEKKEFIKPDKPRKDETPEGQIDKKIKGLESHIKINYDAKIKENEKKLKELEKIWKEDKNQSKSDQRITEAEYKRDKETLEGNIKSNLEERTKTVNYINELRAGKQTAGTAPTEQTYPKGAIVKGKTGNYRFKGGDWKDKKNWEKVP